ncbi:hypothetical protein M9H77_25769 [Catharanthus roseus]|uniref:Uncharacterized protein n=1 Tax=Catharanthus roseus TaxID=4058 RepID=A0ACC0A8R5_CATRO|nr:hypothetical protein M9H77_25769 [Catharanthus roseus]
MSAANWILCSKIFLISTGAISVAMAIKFSVPSILAFAYDDVPTIWSSLVCWLKPPYIYFIVNGIIITIVASSHFSFNKSENPEYINSHQSQPATVSAAPPPKTVIHPPPVHFVTATIPAQTMPEISIVESPSAEFANYEEDEDEISESDIVELKPVVVNGIIEAVENNNYDVAICSPPEADDADDGNFVVSKSPEEAQLDYFPLPVEKKALLPSRFGHRKPSKVIREGGRDVRMARAEAHETLESTWKMIMESREQQLRKSDTFEIENRGRHLNEKVLLDREQSATFKDRTNYDNDASAALGWSSNMQKIKKELSLSQDELNRRVEAFIKKFNEDMRLQRQESINQYMEMINRGAN